MTARRWERSVDHHGEEVTAFARDYFARVDRSVLVIAGGGFDPRSTHVTQLLSRIVGERLHGLLLREERPRPESGLLALAEQNLIALQELAPSHEVARVDVFAPDDAVIGGRSAVEIVKSVPLEGRTDVVVDVSALSVGVSFPVVRHLLERITRQCPAVNLHVIVSANSEIDDLIVPLGSDVFDTVHGFRGGWRLHDTAEAAKLWLPQLAPRQREALRKIHSEIAPDETAPILPFPARRPRRGDDLLDEYSVEMISAWEVDLRNLVYAHEESPLDLYRTVMRIDDARQPVFQEVGGALLFLSPIGSKVLAIGAMMAAIERDFPVVYVEADGYAADAAELKRLAHSNGTLVHVWLHGEAYAQALPVLP